MYQVRYEDIMEESPLNAREREYVLFGRSIELLKKAKNAGVKTIETREAALLTRRLWTILVEDIGDERNLLPKDLKTSLLSIGFFVLREIEKLEKGECVDIDVLIDISQSIRKGLAEQKVSV